MEIWIIEPLRNIGSTVNLAAELTELKTTIYKPRTLLSNRQGSLRQVLEQHTLQSRVAELMYR